MPRKYYWLKMPKDFMTRHDVKMIKRRFGFEGVIYYQSLLLEAIDHNAELRFSKELAYDIESLADAIDAEIVTFTKLVRVLRDKKMMIKQNDGTFYLPFADKCLGSETESAERVRRYRENKETLQCNNEVTESNSQVTPKSSDISEGLPLQCNVELELEKELEIDIDKKVKRFVSPSTQNVLDYCTERKNNVDPDKFIDFYQSKGWMIGKNKMKDWKAAVRTWEKSHTNLNNGLTDLQRLQKIYQEVDENEQTGNS